VAHFNIALLLAYLYFPLSNGYLIVEVLDYSVLPCCGLSSSNISVWPTLRNLLQYMTPLKKFKVLCSVAFTSMSAMFCSLSFFFLLWLFILNLLLRD